MGKTEGKEQVNDRRRPRVHRSGLLGVSSGAHWLESHSLDTQNLLMQGQEDPTASQRPRLPLSPTVLPTRHPEVVVPPYQSANQGWFHGCAIVQSCRAHA